MPLSGGVDLIDRYGLQGWVQETADPESPVTLLLKVDGHVASRTLANLYRPDLEKAGIGSGRYGFALKLDELSPFEPHTIELVREGDDAPVNGTPQTIPAVTMLDDTLQDHLVALLSQAETDDMLKQWAGFLAGQAERLLQRRADAASHKPRPSAPREFRVRWSGRNPAPDTDPAPRALIIDETLPAENRDAGSRVILSHMRSLQRLGFKVNFVASDARGGGTAEMLEAEGITCHCPPWCASVEEVLRRENGGYALIYIHRGTNTRYLPLIRHYQTRARIIYSVADLHHLRLARQAEVEERPELLEASRRVRMAELSAARFVESVITHSTFERAVILKDAPNAKVHVVPWSVPAQPTTPTWQERSGVAFIGSYAHPPNLDAAWWLIQDVMPLVRAKNPAIECILGGTSMPEALQAAVAPGIRPVGFVEDLQGLLGQVRLTTAPLNYGAGLKGKVLDSLAAGVPCACTPMAAEGMDLPPLLQSTIGMGAESLASIIVRLHDDEAFNAACRRAGLDFIEANMSDARVDARMREAVGLAAAR